MLEDRYCLPHLCPFCPTALLQKTMVYLYPKALLLRLAIFSFAISSSFVAQYPAPLSLGTVRDTFTNPKPRRCTTFPSLGMSTLLMDTFPFPSMLTVQLLLNLVRKKTAKGSDDPQVLQPQIPTIHQQKLRQKVSFLVLMEHSTKLLILGLSRNELVINPKVARDEGFSIRPKQRQKGNALHHPFVLATPDLISQKFHQLT